MMIGRTVAAISTARGCGGIAVIRISGDEAIKIADKCFRPGGGRSLSSFAPRKAVYGEIMKGGEVIDTGIAVFFPCPSSFTGEDTVELSCHGGIAVTDAVLSSVLAAGADMAEAGEFTKRAFINGKLTLSEAEAIGDLISADTESKMKLASASSRGILSKKTGELYKELSEVMSALYAAIDYPEEDVGDEGERTIGAVIDEVSSGIKKLLDTYKSGRAIAHGIKAVICGSPNSGKSSLYNALSGEDRAIVTNIAGTTRDVLEETVSCGGATLRLADTAGLRQGGADEVEEIGIERAKNKIKEAELVIAVFDGSRKLTDEEISFALELRSYASEACLIAVINKNDLEKTLSGEDEKLIRDNFDETVYTSAKNGEIGELASLIGKLYGTGELKVSETPIIWEARHKAALERALELLTLARDAFGGGAPIDAACTLCEDALAELGALDGRGVRDDIISGIFSRFCVGK